ncbi:MULTISPECIES: gamma-glutamylcyclotransferase [unclassified Modicisalibacter]|uniref:gamma-glutamylcyclotransferase n=1 Tax=unclassified Modicisalibacter TaxID=2679913 RepID=UPI001CCE9E1C|nr:MULTISPECIES: gamma-glutamylcyclotransferase [unclassified Modicisalibacter]MBZ9558805.1 gamma-glutamylcyclotransferase [Modicisalibacter sp. R2A 31.J]MBZ9575304.1 gamma-glutamylcyclotransferase [Modicisalibacter sp. MOD 31.J]
MSLDTTALNRRMTHFDAHEDFWLFGYGSLIWKADFAYLERCPAHIVGWTRRFWQASHDHRGTPQAPGRVATLVESPGEHCHGMAYRITPETLAPLDHREKNGYRRVVTELHLDDGTTHEGLVYIASEDNAAFAGPAPEPEIARLIDTARGPSGANREYLLKLAAALRDMGHEDAHVFALESLLR